MPEAELSLRAVPVRPRQPTCRPRGLGCEGSNPGRAASTQLWNK